MVNREPAERSRKAYFLQPCRVAPTALPFMLETLRRVKFSFLIPNFLTPHFSFLI